MRRLYAMTALIALLAAATLVLASCGGGGDIGEQPAPHPPASCHDTPEACK